MKYVLYIGIIVLLFVGYILYKPKQDTQYEDLVLYTMKTCDNICEEYLIDSNKVYNYCLMLCFDEYNRILK